MEEMVEMDDVQGIIFKGYVRLKTARYVLLHFTDTTKAKEWIAGLVDRIPPASLTSKNADTAIHIAFTSQGIAKLGFTAEEQSTFPREFTEGMVTEHRQRILGDFNESDPAQWNWGGTNDPTAIHVMLMLFALEDSYMHTLFTNEQVAGEKAAILHLRTLEAHFLPDQKEHFGFRDGIGEPVIKYAGRNESWHDANNINPGEFLFRYRNEYDKYTFSFTVKPEKDPEVMLPVDQNFPALKDLGRNGSMMVFRQLHQDVKAFWNFINQQVQQEPVSETNTMEFLAAKMFGRWPNGSPLTKCPVQPEDKYSTYDNFGYAEKDFDGFKCPIGAHIRRANPRDNFLRHSTSKPDKDIEKSQIFMKRFRILRRGRSYGPPVCASMNPYEVLQTTDADTDRGMLFIAFNSNIGRQFELIQQTRLNNPKFAELYEDPDPIVGFPEIMGEGATTTFTQQAYSIRKKIEGIPRFVWAKGGGYFFLPGIKALRYLGRRK
jgi:Dyp-type peroxidase family